LDDEDEVRDGTDARVNNTAVRYRMQAVYRMKVDIAKQLNPFTFCEYDSEKDI
jgi:hypothetical protein